MSKKKKILVITGIEFEQKTLLDRDVISGFGYGKRKSNIAVRKYINSKPDCIVSFGFAGSTSEKINCGDIIIPDKIISQSGKINLTSKKYREYFKKKLSNYSCCTSKLFSSDQLINTPQKKEIILKKFGALAVDMETSSIQNEAKKKRIPFVCIRVILDNKKSHVPKEFGDFFSEDSKIIKAKVLKLILTKPWIIYSFIRMSFYFFKSLVVLRGVSKKVFDKRSF